MWFITETVVVCGWPQPDTMECKNLRNDLEFDHNVTDRLTLWAPAATDRLSGSYLCQLMPPKDAPAPIPCIVIFEGKWGATHGVMVSTSAFLA